MALCKDDAQLRRYIDIRLINPKIKAIAVADIMKIPKERVYELNRKLKKLKDSFYKNIQPKNRANEA